MKYIVTNIIWDTDGMDVSLPSEMIVDVLDCIDNQEAIELFISDEITDVTGYCHGGFSYEKD